VYYIHIALFASATAPHSPAPWQFPVGGLMKNWLPFGPHANFIQPTLTNGCGLFANYQSPQKSTSPSQSGPVRLAS